MLTNMLQCAVRVNKMTVQPSNINVRRMQRGHHNCNQNIPLQDIAGFSFMMKTPTQQEQFHLPRSFLSIFSEVLVDHFWSLGSRLVLGAHRAAHGFPILERTPESCASENTNTIARAFHFFLDTETYCEFTPRSPATNKVSVNCSISVVESLKNPLLWCRYTSQESIWHLTLTS